MRLRAIITKMVMIRFKFNHA